MDKRYVYMEETHPNYERRDIVCYELTTSTFRFVSSSDDDAYIGEWSVLPGLRSIESIRRIYRKLNPKVLGEFDTLDNPIEVLYGK